MVGRANGEKATHLLRPRGPKEFWEGVIKANPISTINESAAHSTTHPTPKVYVIVSR